MENKTQRQRIEPSLIKRILVRGANWVGDALMTTPALSCVRRAFPAASISVLAVPQVEGVYRDHPDLDHMILYERSSKTGTAGGPFRVASSGFDMASFPIHLQSACSLSFK
jgi:heptosyltransferase-2